MAKMTPKTDSTQNEPVSSQDKVLSQILERVNKLEEENKQLKDNKPRDPKKKYEWPNSYSYKMWNDIAICDYSSKKKDPARDLTYVNPKGDVVDNQILVLKLADWTNVETFMTEFHKWYTKSEQVFPVSERTVDWDKKFTFESNWEKFEVSSRIIN